MNIVEIKDLMQAFKASGLTAFEVTEGDFSLRFENAPPAVVAATTVSPMPAPVAPAAANPSAVADNNFVAVKAPLVGVFYQSASPNEKPFVSVGDSVKKGDVLCLIESMKVLNEVKSPASGVIRCVCAQNEQLLGFGETIFEIEA